MISIFIKIIKLINYKIIDKNLIDIQFLHNNLIYDFKKSKLNKSWGYSSLSELTTIIFIMELTHLGSETCNYCYI